MTNSQKKNRLTEVVEPYRTRNRRYVVRSVVFAQDITEAVNRARYGEIIDVTLDDEIINKQKVGFL